MKKLQEKSTQEPETVEYQRKPKMGNSSSNIEPELNQEETPYKDQGTDYHRKKKPYKDHNKFDEEDYWSIVNQEDGLKPDYTNPNPKKVIRKESEDVKDKVVINIGVNYIFK